MENEIQDREKTEEEVEKEEQDVHEARKNLIENLQKQNEERIRLIREGNEAISQGKGRLRLETPFTIGGNEITELCFDFMTMKGNEYTDAMGCDPMANNSMRITPRQALSLFAKSAARNTEGVDMNDILENIGMTDSVEAVQVATLFFNASTQAGRMRISKK